MFRKLFGHSRNCRRPALQATRSRRPVLRVEEMESRLVPSAFVGISNGVLQVNCTGSENDVAVDHILYVPFLGPATRIEANGSATIWAESSFTKISINTVASGGDRIYLQANVKPVEMYLGNSNQVYVGHIYNNLDRIQGFVTVAGLGFGDRLGVLDGNNPRSETWQLGSGDANQGYVARAGAATIVFTGMQGGVNVYGSGGTSSYTVAQTHGFRTTLTTASAGDTVNVWRTTGELDVYGLGNAAVVNVSEGGSVQNIHGPVIVAGGTNATVNIDDQYDRDLRVPKIDNYTPAGDTAYARVLDLAPAPISTRCASTLNMIVRTGVGEAVPQVMSTRPLGPNGTGVLTLEGHSDQTYVTVRGNDGTAQDIQGTLRITNPRVFTGLYVYDTSDTVSRDVHLDSAIIGDGLYGQITGLAPAAIQYRYNQTSYLSVYTGPAGASINVQGTGVDTYLNIDGSNNSVVLGGASSLQSLQGQVTIRSYTGLVYVDINDVADTENRTVTLDTYTPTDENVEVFGLTPRPITIESSTISALDIEGGSGNNTFEVQNTSSSQAFPTRIYPNFGNNTVNVHATSKSPLSVYLSGNDTVNIGDAANGLAYISTPLNVVGNAIGAGDTIKVLDQANPNTETYTVTDTDLSTSKGQVVSFQDFDTLVLYPSFDPNTSVIDAHDPNLYTLVISYDPPPAAPPPGGGGGTAPSLSREITAETLPIDGSSTRSLTETVQEGTMDHWSAAPVSDAMLVDILSRTLTGSSLQ